MAKNIAAPVEQSATEKVLFRDLREGDAILNSFGGVQQVMGITLVPSQMGGDPITGKFTLAGECGGPGSCKHAYVNRVNLDMSATRLVK